MKTRVIILTTLIVISTLWSCKEKQAWKPNPPFPGLEVAQQSHTINPNADTTILLPSGTTIKIPSGCFSKKNGEKASGKVTLRYREFHDAVDIFLSGIHMDFISMGEKRFFQTAGMFEVNANEEGEELMITEGKHIDIRFGSKYPGEDYSFFYLNPLSGAWEWVDLPSTEQNAEKAMAKDALKGRMPTLFMGDEYFVLNYMGFLDVYFGNNREIIYKQRNSKAVRNKLEAYKVKMYDAITAGEIRFGKAYYHPVELLWKDMDDKSFPNWTKEIELDWKYKNNQWFCTNCIFKSIGPDQYELTLSDKGKTLKKRMQAVLPLKNLLKFAPDEWKRKYDEALAQVAEEQAQIDAMAETYRAFSVNRLGVYNFDALMKLDEWFHVSPTFTISNIEQQGKDAVIIFGDNSGYITVKANDIENMRINPESGHRILMMLQNNEVGIFPAQKFKEWDIETLRKEQKPNVEFIMEQHKVTDVLALRELLGFN